MVVSMNEERTAEAGAGDFEPPGLEIVVTAARLEVEVVPRSSIVGLVFKASAPVPRS